MSDIAAVGEKRVFEPFDKEAFKKEILNNIKYLFRKTPETASQQEIFQAVAYASKDMIIDEWLNAHKEYEKQDAKTVYYLSMEFLMGRALGNNLINLCCYKEVAEVLQRWDWISMSWKTRSRMRLLAMAALVVLRPASLNPCPH